jgi:small subunit ribosomal protein S21
LLYCYNGIEIKASKVPAGHYFVHNGGEVAFLAGIIVKDNESFESALRRFKKVCEREGRLSEYKRHQHFEKPSERRKRKTLAARRKLLKKVAQQAGY